jgi:hypothetical protein
MADGLEIEQRVLAIDENEVVAGGPGDARDVPGASSRTGMPSETPPACMSCLIGFVSLSSADMTLLRFS